MKRDKYIFYNGHYSLPICMRGYHSDGAAMEDAKKISIEKDNAVFVVKVVGKVIRELQTRAEQSVQRTGGSVAQNQSPLNGKGGSKAANAIHIGKSK